MVLFLTRHLRTFLVSLLIFSSYSAASFAATHEINLGLGQLNFTEGASAAQFQTGYQLRFIDWMSVGGGFDYLSQSFQDSNAVTWSIFGGGTAYIGPGLDNFFFSAGFIIRAGSGSTTATTTTDPTGFGLGLFFGKRFMILPNILYRPSIGFISAGSSGFVFYPAQVAMVF